MLNKFAQKFCRVPNSYTNELMGERVPTEIPKNEIKSKNKSDSRNPTENAQDSDPSIKSQQTQRTQRTKEWNRRIQRDKWNARRPAVGEMRTTTKQTSTDKGSQGCVGNKRASASVLGNAKG